MLFARQSNFGASIMLAILVVTTPSISISQTIEERFCSSLRGLVSAAESGFVKFRGKQTENSEEWKQWRGTEIFGSVNRCYVDIESDGHYYGCFSETITSKAQQRSVYEEVVALSGQCLKKLHGRWIFREGSFKRKHRHGRIVEFDDPMKDMRVRVRLTYLNSRGGWRTDLGVEMTK